MRVKPIIWSTLLAAALSVPGGLSHADKLFTELGPIKAFLADDFVCASKVRLKLLADSEAVFSQDKTKLEALVGGVRSALGFQCDGIADMLVSGAVGDKTVFAAVASKATGWKLIDVPVSLVEAQKTVAAARPALPPAAALPQSPEDRGAGSGVTALALPPSGTTPAPGPVLPGAAPTIPPSSPNGQASGLERFRALNKTIEAGNFPVDGYKFAGLMTAIHLGNSNDIPDDQKTRSLVVSVLRAFSENCGDAPTDVALMAIKYASPQMRQMERNPAQGIANMLMGFANMRDRALDTGDFTGAMSDWAGSQAIFSVEGMQDGRTFISHHGCRGDTFDQFSSRLHRLILSRARSDPKPYDEVTFSKIMSPKFRALNGFKDPDAILKERRMASLVNETTASCKKAFDSDGFCSCAIGKLKNTPVTEDVWRDIGREFKAVTRYAELRPLMSSCY